MMTQGRRGVVHWLALRRIGEPRAPADTKAAEQEQVWTVSALHERYLADVFSYVARRVPDRQEAEDVTAEVFAAAFVALPRRKSPSGPYPWLLGIARRKVADALRRRGRRESRTAALTEETPAASSDQPEAALARQERALLIHKMLAVLPEDQREALLLHYVEGLPQAHVAAVLGRSPAAVNSLLQRARAAVYRQGRNYFLGESEADK